MDESNGEPRQQDAAHATTRLRRFRLALFGRLSAGLLRLLGWTWRWQVLGQDPRPSGDAAPGAVREPSLRTGATTGGRPTAPDDPGHLAAFFHESLLPAAFRFRDRAYSVAVSRSRDGDLIEATLRRLGYADPARGSSSRGGSAALLALVRKIEAGTTVAVLVDGPRGPACASKPGIVTLARLTGQPIQPVAFAARPALRLGSWDRSLIPLPFARVVCAFGEPLDVDPEDASEEAAEAATAGLDEALGDLYARAEAALEERDGG